MDLKNIQPNVPKVDISEYFIILAGVGKSGKTTLFAKMVEEYFGDVNKGLILAMEKGYSALKVNAQDIEDWDDFEEAVEQLVEDRDEMPFKMLGLDTIDILWEYAQDSVVKEWNKDNPTKRTKDINGVGAKKAGGQGFGVGYNRAKTKIRKTVDRLMKAGYGIVAITHSKDKEVEEKNGFTYDQLVISLPQSARDIFVNMADFINFLTIEKEKDGNDVNTKRYIYFRSDGYVEAGGRFQNLPERIEYDVSGYINTIEEAIRSEFEEGTDVEKLRKEQEGKKEAKAQEFVEKEKEKSELENVSEEDLKANIKEALKGKSDEDKKELQTFLNDEIGVKALKEITDKEDLAKVYKHLSE